MILRLTPIVALILLFPAAVTTASASERPSTVAVFPVENLSAGAIPADAIRQVLTDRLVAAGVVVLASDALEEFMTRHRVRYASGIDTTTAEALRRETGVDGVLIASVELSSEEVPPRVAIVARLVSVRAAPMVTWADDVGMAGDDAPGLLDLGVVEEFPTLLSMALERLAQSLHDYLTTERVTTGPRPAEKYRPRIAYQGLRLEPGRPYSVAVLPFFNRSERRNAGEILALLFMRHLSALESFRVAEAGDVRQQLLLARIIMEGGASTVDAEAVWGALDTDFVVAGRVHYYEDSNGPAANPRVEFSVVLFDRASRKVVWSSQSHNEGHDGVRFFGRGRSGTAHAMASQMVRSTIAIIAGDRK